MGADVQTIVVPSPEHMEQTITGYIGQGFTVQTRTVDSATLFKKKEFSTLWLVIGLLLCLIPLIVYLFVYAGQRDQMIVVRVVTAGELTGVMSGLPAQQDISWSPDRKMWWDGTKWLDASINVPLTATYSDDHAHWWDGQDWRPVPETEPQ